MVFRYPTTRHPMQQFRDDMDRLLTGFLGQVPDWALPGAVRGQPAVNLWETPEALKVEAELPGVKNDRIELSAMAGELSIRVSGPDEPEQGVAYHRRERPAGSFSRVLRLPCEVDPDRIEADLRDGVLTVTLPKAEGAKPRKIAVGKA